MAPVNRVTIHHQGGGAPTDNSSGYSHGGYTYGIGSTRWEWFRTVWDSYATLNFNGESLDICLSGSRGNTDPAYPVTDNDIELIRGAVADARARGYVTDHPDVIPHKNSPGSSTACPGDNAMARFDDIEDACQAGSAPPKPEPPEDNDMMGVQASAINHDGRPVVFQVGGDKKLYMRIRDATGGSWRSWQDISGGFNDFNTVTAFINPKNKAINIWVTMKDGKSFQKWQEEPDFAKWSGWEEMTR